MFIISWQHFSYYLTKDMGCRMTSPCMFYHVVVAADKLPPFLVADAAESIKHSILRKILEKRYHQCKCSLFKEPVFWIITCLAAKLFCSNSKLPTIRLK
jgi:hypothetical protein